MSSQITGRLSRQVMLSAMLVLVIAAVTSCSRRSVPFTPRSQAPVIAPAVTAFHQKTSSLKARLPFAFPVLDTGQISSVQFSPDGRRLAFGYGTDAETSMWNLETGRLSWQRHVEGASGGPVVFGRHGKILIIQCSDPDFEPHIWICTPSGQLIRKLPGYDGAEYSPVVYLENSDHFLVTSGERFRAQIVNDQSSHLIPFTEVWNTRTWHLTDRVSAMLLQPVPLTSTGRIILRAKSLSSHRLDSFDESSIFELSRGNFFVRLSGNDADKGQIAVFNAHSRKKLWAVAHKRDCPRVAAISPDSRTLAVGSIGGMVELRDLPTGRLLHRIHCSNDVIRCLTYSPNGRVLAAAGGEEFRKDGIRLLDSQSGRILAVLKADFSEQSETEKDWTLDHPDWFAFLPDFSYLASEKVVQKIRMSGRTQDSGFIHRFSRPWHLRAALHKCYSREAS